MGALGIPAWFEVGSLVVLTAVLAVDLALALRRPHVPSLRESALTIAGYTTLALLFAVALFVVTGDGDAAGQFVAGWLTEYSLSVDNLFVFLLLMTQFAVPPRYQQVVLMVGIVVALILRAVAIVVGATLIAEVEWIFYVFGLFLVYTGVRQAFSGSHDDDSGRELGVVRLVRRLGGDRPDAAGSSGFPWRSLLLVFVAIGATDLVFAVDSIPAVFGVTTSAFLVFTANVFALMGLRQLYFLLGALLDRLAYLHYGIAVVLVFIGVKLVLQGLAENDLPFLNGGEPIAWAPVIPTWVSLVVIVVAMGVAALASLAARRPDPSAG